MIDHGFGVKLGPVSDVDKDTLRGWRNNPEIYKWCRQYEPLESWNHESWLESMKNGRSDVKMYTIWDGGIDLGGIVCVGVCGLTSIDWVNSRAEFSLYIDPSKQNHGLGRASLLTLCKHGFDTLNLNCIWGESFHGNKATDMFQSIGFQMEGVGRSRYFRDGKYIDAYNFSILKEEFHDRNYSSCGATNNGHFADKADRAERTFVQKNSKQRQCYDKLNMRG